MKTLAVIAVFASLAAARPYELIRSRPFYPRDLNATTGCPRNLPMGNFEVPSSIVTISKPNPDTAYGNAVLGIITPGDVSSIFIFNIPESRANQTCTLEFLFPSPPQLNNNSSSYTYSGADTFFFTGYSQGYGGTANTTYNNQPPAGPYTPFPAIHMEPGNAYTIDIGPCAAGLVSGMTGSNDTTLVYFQDATSGSCPMGIFVEYSG